MKETKKQTIDRLIRENQGRLYGYMDAAHRSAAYLNLLSSFAIGQDICSAWRAAYLKAVNHDRYIERKNRTQSLSPNA